MFSDFDDFLGGLLPSTDEMRDAGFAGLGGFAASALHGAVTDLIRRKIDPEKDKDMYTTVSGDNYNVPMFGSPMWKALMAAGIGVLGGRAAYELNPSMAAGVLGAMGGKLGDQVYDMVLHRHTVRTPLPEGEAAAKAAVMSMNDMMRQLVAAGSGGGGTAGLLANAQVYEQRDDRSFADAEVEEESGVLDAIIY